MHSLYPRLFVALIAAIWLARLSPSHASGFIVVERSRPLVPETRPFAPIANVRHEITTKIENQLATTTVEQEFYNPNDRNLEGTYLFPVPKNSRIDKLQMDVGGKMIDAELLPAEKARSIYEDIVRSQKDPALLEYVDRDTFRLRIFPIEAKSKKRVRLTYTQLLAYDAGTVKFRYPLSTAGVSRVPVEKASLRVDIKSATGVGPVLCPSHEATITRDGPNAVTVTWEEHDFVPNGDFEVVFTQAKTSEIAASVITWRRAGDDEGYFLLLASPPPAKGREDQASPKDVVLVADTSGSMAGEKMLQAKKALAFCIANLNDDDRFELIGFSTEVRPVFQSLVAANESHRARALEAVEKMKAIGGTAIEGALTEALETLRGSDRPAIVIFVTDGLPTVGESDSQKIIATATKAGPNVRIFSFGVGSEVNTRLLDGIAEKTRAFSQYVVEKEDLEIKLSNFFTRISDPVLTALECEPEGSVKWQSRYPASLPDLFSGDQLVLSGRYSGSGKTTIRLRGKVDGKHVEHTFEAEFPVLAEENEFVARLWATRRVAWLLDEMRDGREEKELVDEITRLAREFGIVTPYTAYLILEDEARRNVPLAQRTFQEIDRNEAARRVAQSALESFRAHIAGEAAVAGARVQNLMKYAGSDLAGAAGSVPGGSREAWRAVVASGPVSETAPGEPDLVRLAEARQKVADVASATRRVGGKTFIQNGAQWVDAEAQALTSEKLRRIQFDSVPYYELLASSPDAARWLSLGKNVLIAHKDELIEIYE